MGRRRTQTVGYRYRIGLHLVLCQGPVDAVQEILVGERTAWGDAERASLPIGHGLGSLSIDKPHLFGGDAREGGVVGSIDVLSGHAGQGRNDYLMGRLGSSIPAFRGVLSLVARKILFAANNPHLKPWAVRVRRCTQGWAGVPWNGGQAEVEAWDEHAGRMISVGMNPAHILVQCLTDPHWGMGYPQDDIGWSFWEAAWALSSEGFGLNLIWTRQQPIETFIGQIVEHIGAILYIDPEQGRFELKLLRQDYSIDNLPQLGPDEIVRLERYERAQWGELPNEITVVYTDWSTGGDATVTVENLAAIQLQGGVINQRRDYPGVNYGPLAARLALRDLRALGSPLARMTLTVARHTLERAPLPGDVFLLNWPRLGVERMVVRVTGIDTGPLGATEWRIDAMEDVFGMSNTVLSPPPPTIDEPTLEPLPPALVLAVEVPYWELARRLSRAELAFLTDTDTYLGALAAAGGPGQLNWQLVTGVAGTHLAVSADADYAPLFTIDAPLPASSVHVHGLPVRALSQPDRLAVGDYAYLVDASGAIREAVAIQLQGGVINQRRDYPGVNYGPLAARLALRDLRALGSPLARMTLTVARHTLERAPLPGDVFLLNWPRLGVERMVVRVTGIDTGPLGATEWRIDAMEDVFGMSNTVLSPPPPTIDEPTLEPLPPALVLAVEVPYWELARRLSRAELSFLTDTDTYLGALAAAGGPGQLNWQLVTGVVGTHLAVSADADYAPLFTIDAPLPASSVHVHGLPVRALSQPDRLAVGDYAYLVDASGAIREAVAILGYHPAGNTIDLARGVLDTTPQAHALGTRLIGVGDWLGSEGVERAPGESVFVGAMPRTYTDQGDPVLAAQGQPLVLAGRQAMPYPPGRLRLNGQADPAVVAGDLGVAWAHRDRTQQTAYLVPQDEGDIGPEPGVSYTLRIRNRNGVLVRTETGLLGTAYIWTAAVAALDAGALGDRITVEIRAERDGWSSWQPQVRAVDRAGYGLRWGQHWGGA